MQAITSVQNQLVKKIDSLKQKKFRNELNLFLLEGYKGVTEAIKDGLDVDCVFVQQGFGKELPAIDEEKIFEVTEAVMKKITSTESPPEIAASVVQKKFSLKDFKKAKNPLIIVLEGIKDAGNLGTIIRTACASEATGIVLLGNTVDIYNPKTVRATTANIWKIPIVQIETIAELKSEFKECNFLVTAVDEKMKNYVYYDVDYNKPTIIAFGSEADGVTQELLKSANSVINIPMSQKVESLNLSISVGVVLYEALRKRKYNNG